MRKVLISGIGILFLGGVGLFAYPYIRVLVLALQLNRTHSVSTSQISKATLFDIREEPIHAPNGEPIGFKLFFKVKFPEGLPVNRKYWSWYVRSHSDHRPTLPTVNPHTTLIGVGTDDLNGSFLPGRTYEMSGLVTVGCVAPAIMDILEKKPLNGTEIFCFDANDRANALADTVPHPFLLTIGGMPQKFETQGSYTLKQFYESGLRNGINDGPIKQ
jgi:hypothetical protein